MTWGAELRRLRRRAGLTQADLGRALLAEMGEPATESRGQGLVSRLERGVRCKSAERAARIAQILARALGRPLGLPPVDAQAGRRQGARGGDRQHRPDVCPCCGGTGRA